MESDLHILDMSTYYTQLLQFLVNSSQDAAEFLTGGAVPFPGVPIKKDEVWAALVIPSPRPHCSAAATNSLQIGGVASSEDACRPSSWRHMGGS